MQQPQPKIRWGGRGTPATHARRGQNTSVWAHPRVSGTCTAGMRPPCRVCTETELEPAASAVVQLQVHPVMHLIVRQRDVVLVHIVPFLNPDLLWPRAWEVGKPAAGGVRALSSTPFTPGPAQTACRTVPNTGALPIWAATSFLRSPMVSSSLHLTLTCGQVCM